MKKLMLLALVVPLVFSCRKDGFEGERPDERLAQALTHYNELLSSAEYGWKGHLFPAGGSGYGFLFKFDGKNRVSMLADISEVSGETAKESSYRLKAALLPSLYFDTYSYLHLLADPDPGVNGGTPGWGLHSDFEFSILEASTDTIKLKGNLLGSELTLIRATQEEGAAYEAGNLNNIRTDLQAYLASNRFNFLTTNSGNPVAVDLNVNSKVLSLSYDSAGTLVTRAMGFAFSGLRDIVLPQTVHVNNLEFSGLRLAADNTGIYLKNSGQEQALVTAEKPIFTFYQMLGVQFNNVIVPLETPVPGNGSEFNARREQFLVAAKEGLLEGTALPEMQLMFNKEEGSLVINVVVVQGADTFQTLYGFYYTWDGSAFRFEYVGPLNGNASALETAFTPIIQGILAGSLNFDYEVVNGEVMAAATSSQIPAFKFIGHLH